MKQSQARIQHAALTAIAAGAMLVALPAQHAQAQPQPQPQPQTAAAIHHAIAPGALGPALAQYGAALGASIAIDSTLVAGRTTRGLNGSYAPAEGFARLLDGTDLELLDQGNRNYSLRRLAIPDHPATLSAVTVSAELDPGTEGSGSYTSPAMNTATGLTLSQRQTPQSVSVIGRQQMDDFNLTTLQDVAQATPGIYSKSQAVSDQETSYYARGFAVSQVSVDGLGFDVTGFNERNVSADMVMYDRVEVVRGATGLMQGAGAPAGSINLIRKRPTATPLFNAAAGYGSWHDRQLTADVSRALNQTGTLRARVAGSWRDSDSFVDVVNHQNATLYGIVEGDLTPDTTLGVGFSTQRSRTNGVFVGLPTFADGRHMDLPRSTYLNNADSFQDRDNDVLFADLEQRLNNGWRARFAVSHIDASSTTRNTTNSRIDGQDYQLSQSETGWQYDTRQLVADARLSGPVDWFGRRHEVLIGASYRNDDSTAAQSWDSRSNRTVNLGSWNPYQYQMVGGVVDPYNWARKTREKGLYAAANLSLADPLHLVLGGRFGWYTQDVTGWYESAATWKRSLDASAKFTPYAGLVYDVSRQHSLYASATKIFQPQSSMDVNGNTLPPLAGTNLELGVKGEYFDRRLNASAAVFHIDQTNRAMRDEINCPTGGRLSCSRAAGEVESEGVDVQVSGQLAPGWQLTGGYTWVLAKYTRDSNAANIGQRTATDEPRHLFKLFTNYQLGQWNLGGSVYAQDKIYRSETGYHTAQGAYAIAGLTAGYRIDSHWQLRVNVENLFDRKYYSALGYSWSGGLDRYGAPRSLLVSLNYRM